MTIAEDLDKYRAPALDRGLDILELLAATEDGLSQATPPIRRLVSQATPVLRRFAREAEQAVHLVIHDRSVLVVVAQVDSPGYWNVSVRVGSRIDIVNTGSGHIFLAFATDEERALMLEDQGE